MSKKDLFDTILTQSEDMFKRADKMFSDFATRNTDLFRTTTITQTYDKDETEDEDFVLEFKAVEMPASLSREGLTDWLNTFGQEGWDLKCFEYRSAIFSRPVVTTTEEEE